MSALNELLAEDRKYAVGTKNKLYLNKVVKAEEELATMKARIAELEAEREWLTDIPKENDIYIGWNTKVGLIMAWFENGKFYMYGSNKEIHIDKYQPLPKPPEEK